METEKFYINKKNSNICLIFMLMAVVLCGCRRQKEYEQAADLPVITIGCDDYSPFSYADANGEMTGIDVELAKEAFSRMGYYPEFIFINLEDNKDLLTEGAIDCVWSGFIMEECDKEYRWAGPYMQRRQVVAVNEDSDIYTLKDLEEKVIAVQATTRSEDIIRSHDGIVPQLRKVISVQKRDLIFIMLSKGYVDALAAHDTSIDQFMKDTGIHFRVLQEPLQAVKLGVAFDINDERGIEVQLTDTIHEMLKDGTIEGIVGKYLSDTESYLKVWNE